MYSAIHSAPILGILLSQLLSVAGEICLIYFGGIYFLIVGLRLLLPPALDAPSRWVDYNPVHPLPDPSSCLALASGNSFRNSSHWT